MTEIQSPTSYYGKSDLIRVADAYKAAARIAEDTTVSHRVFRDTKKLAALRRGGDITMGRFETAMRWFAENWPSRTPIPVELGPFAISSPDGAANQISGNLADAPPAVTASDAA